MKAFIALLATLWLSFSALAHHSTNHFDIERRVTLTGTVEQYEYKNPHVYFRVRGILVGEEGGEEQLWEVEGQGIPLLANKYSEPGIPITSVDL